jgi:hypothetical protein
VFKVKDFKLPASHYYLFESGQKFSPEEIIQQAQNGSVVFKPKIMLERASEVFPHQ